MPHPAISQTQKILMMRTIKSCVALALTFALAGAQLAHAQQLSTTSQPVLTTERKVTGVTSILDTEPPPLMRLRTPQTIIATFLQTESQLREALKHHTFKRDVVLQTIGSKGQVTGEYVRNSEFVFDDRGNRMERVTYHPPSTIREMRITKEDIQDLAGAQLLGVDIAESNKYHFHYRGEELLDGKRVYVLNVEPASKPNPQRMGERYFRGSVWIDAVTFQMVKVRGIVEPQGKQRFPLFETWRESAGATFAFPSRTVADDVLRFPNRNVNYRIRVRYYDYKLFASTVVVKEIDQPGN